MEEREKESAMKQASLKKAEGDKLANYLTSLGHIGSDINQGALAAVLPFLVMYDGYSYAAVATLIFAANIASAIIQPLFGWIGDKHPSPWLMALGVFLAGFGMTGIGFLDSYAGIVACALISGIGVAMFHPEGGRLANLAAGQCKGNGMSIFAVGGNIGFFVGPILAATFLGILGMHGTLVFLFPATAIALLLLAFTKRFRALGSLAGAKQAASQQTEHWGLFAGVLGALSMRSIVEYGLTSFIPLFLVGVLGAAEGVGSVAISVFAIAGVVATFMSGKVAEKVGGHRILILGMGLSAVFLVVFAFSQSIVLSLVLTVALAIVTDVYYASTVALGMSYVPQHLGMASGLSYGVAVCIGGVAEPFLGMLGDAVGLQPVMIVLACIAAAGALVGVALKAAANPEKREAAKRTANAELGIEEA